MTVKKLKENFSLVENSNIEGLEGNTIEFVFMGDLMSDVLVIEEEEILLVTSLNTEQSIQTAHMVDAVAVLLVNGKVPSEKMVSLANSYKIALFTTELSSYETAKRLDTIS